MKRLLFILAVLVVLVACGGDQEEQLVGHWVAIPNSDFTQDFLPDGTFVMSLFGEAVGEGEWTIENGELCTTVMSNTSCDQYEVDGDYLSMVVLGEVLRFRRE